VFEGEKTWVFWLGLIILASASVSLFSLVWYTVLYAVRYNQYYVGFPVDYEVPIIVGVVVFILVGWYMMKSGTRKQRLPEIQPLKQQ
jgi:uncharacterized membrane protein YhdT